MDIPVVAMVMRSGWVARLVLLLLVVFSVLSWGIVINRLLCFGTVGRLHRRVRGALDSAAGLAELQALDERAQRSPMGMLVAAGTAEHRRILADIGSHTKVTDWSFFLESQFAMAAERLDAIVSASVGRLDRGLVQLAVMSSASPLLGLFGTVWGVMNSFFQIGNQGNASLPVVAPGIAEALITTVIGLAVAIPALLFYNLFVHRVERIEDELATARDTVALRLRRDVLAKLYGGGQTT